jgi:hypothetical protein
MVIVSAERSPAEGLSVRKIVVGETAATVGVKAASGLNPHTAVSVQVATCGEACADTYSSTCKWKQKAATTVRKGNYI